MDIALAAGWGAAGLAVGAAVGWILARSGGGAQEARALRAEQMLRDEAAKAQAAIAAAESRAKREIAALQAEMDRRLDALGAEHRAESEKLARHLTEAYDELDGLRAKVEAARNLKPGDTGHGFAATLPLSDL